MISTIGLTSNWVGLDHYNFTFKFNYFMKTNKTQKKFNEFHSDNQKTMEYEDDISNVYLMMIQSKFFTEHFFNY